MIPHLPDTHSISPLYQNFLIQLQKSGFKGSIKSDPGTRLITATDNSVYQLMPQSVIFPKNIEDLKRVLLLLQTPNFQSISITARGGGTGTNGQSLTEGLVIDLSLYFREILELNIQEQWVRVQPGVILDQLNDYLKPHGLFFAPTVSTSSRATLGGMISTDASGKGSRIYGKTSQHLIELESLLLDGTLFKSKKTSKEELEAIKQQNNIIGKIYRLVDQIVTGKKDLIAQKMPKMNRFLSGYNLEKIYDPSNKFFDINYLLAGSEGTLGFITEAKLKLTPIPKFKKVLVAKYQLFEDALADADVLINRNPSAIETIDDKILELAREDEIFHKVKHMIGDIGEKRTAAINIIEYSADDSRVLDQQIEHLEQFFKKENSGSKAIGYFKPTLQKEMDALWAFRKKGVGLLANTKGRRRPIAFVEDTAVPPHNLSAYIKEFRSILEAHGLSYGMFGHVDVGCLHVRPALDMREPEDEALLYQISDQIVELTIKYGGVIWGEHGKGLRSEYSPRFFGEELYQDLRRIKGLFDPNNQLNPGKIATPIDSDQKLGSLKSQTRGQLDRTIRDQWQVIFENSINCNGNGACFNYQPDDVMCPSAKSTLDRIHSPKGRAGLIREWIRRISLEGYKPGISMESNIYSPIKLYNTLRKKLGVYDYSNEVYQAMMGCLSCKACSTQCPVKVDIPDLKSKFIELYHTRYLRPIKDHLVGNIEYMAKLQSYFPILFNLLLLNPVSQMIVKRFVGMVDLPKLGKHANRDRKQIKRHISNRSKAQLAYQKEPVVILQDAFTSFYDVTVFSNTIRLVSLLGYQPLIQPFFPNGKPLHIKGLLNKFDNLVKKNHEKLNKLATSGIPIIGIDPAITLTFRDEYLHSLKISETNYKVQLIQEWLASQIKDSKFNFLSNRSGDSENHKVYMFGHCTEKTAVFNAESNWEQVFNYFKIPMEIIQVGCCGMGGTYGHERENASESRKIYELSWGRKIAQLQAKASNMMATGYSCRCQVKRFGKFRPAHPVEILVNRLGGDQTTP